MTKRQIPMLVKIAALIFLLYAAVKIVGLQSQIAEKKDQLNSLNMRVEEYEASNEAMKEDLKSGISDEDISEIARTELGYAEPGERVFVDTSSR
ncbi:septum formation initiator family protein [Butyricicoccus faecihominis]|uniref:FtsB family cell division protein n=2 Tax=Butyricicoccaceae TaxID=3085642 RepID=UPI0029587481|nr:septum formation initiator family protein [Agathobaculum sp. NTUH-O15-33]MCQ5128837.1 septum formation initiator family protein [Butyricicoccus faecihominis]WNX83154.1 septum formation initiator family protein [Agathobaculum sp. NTUH-O15-33]